MLESMLEMAASLEITAVAEGIERREEWDMLLELGCDEGQGFLLARPMDRASYLEWLRRYSPLVPAASASATNSATESVSPRRVESIPALR
jgi:EAL domain-containing protein (putative c-di-GMP-specific phosphodiesterase class I)